MYIYTHTQNGSHNCAKCARLLFQLYNNNFQWISTVPDYTLLFIAHRCAINYYSIKAHLFSTFLFNFDFKHYDKKLNTWKQKLKTIGWKYLSSIRVYSFGFWDFHWNFHLISEDFYFENNDLKNFELLLLGFFCSCYLIFSYTNPFFFFFFVWGLNLLSSNGV